MAQCLLLFGITWSALCFDETACGQTALSTVGTLYANGYFVLSSFVFFCVSFFFFLAWDWISSFFQHTDKIIKTRQGYCRHQMCVYRSLIRNISKFELGMKRHRLTTDGLVPMSLFKGLCPIAGIMICWYCNKYTCTYRISWHYSRQPLRCGDSVHTQTRRPWGDIQGSNGAGGLPRTECLW